MSGTCKTCRFAVRSTQEDIDGYEDEIDREWFEAFPLACRFGQVKRPNLWWRYDTDDKVPNVGAVAWSEGGPRGTILVSERWGCNQWEDKAYDHG